MTIRRREAKSGTRWDVEWLLPDGTKRSKTFKTLRAAIEEWHADKAVIAPVAALFRVGKDWAAFRVVDNRAERVIVDIGRMNGREAEVKSGLAAGDRVIVHPSDTIAGGTLIAPRTE